MAYIEREAVLKIISKYDCSSGSLIGHHSGAVDVVGSAIYKLPAADVAPVKHGHIVWKEYHKGGIRRRKCLQEIKSVYIEQQMPCKHIAITDERYLSKDPYCSECGKLLGEFLNYCGNCGAKMNGGENKTMEREILFRAKAINRDIGSHRTNYKNGDWIYGLVTRLYDNRFENLPAEMKDLSGVIGIEIDHNTIGQYTGLTDKNGVKIFEGDIVRYGDTIHEVVFEQRNGTAYFGLVYSKSETLPFGHYQDLRQIEVIGNIYDNGYPF